MKMMNLVLETYKPVDTRYTHRLWKQDVRHILLLYVKENIRMQQTYYALLIRKMKDFFIFWFDNDPKPY